MKNPRLAATGIAASLLFAGTFLSGSLSTGSLFAQQVKEIAFESAGDFLTLPPDTFFGEVAGVATTSKGDIYVYNQGGGPNATIGASRNYLNGAPRLFEFDKAGKFVREIGSGPNNRPYDFLYAQGVRVDPQDNFWVVDRASRMVVKFDGVSAKVLLTLGRRLEAIGETGSSAGYGRVAGGPGSGVAGDNFDQPTDVAWDAAGNIFVSDAYKNGRIAKFDKNGKFIKSWGQLGAEHGQFNIPHSLAVDAKGNVYVADMGNERIQVFDNDGTFKSEIKNVGATRAICISPGAHQYLYSSNSNTTEDPFLNGQISKLELDGTVIGQFGKAGKQFKEFGMVNEIDCRDPNTLYVAEMMNWRVQKISLK